jgi:hypothetical protein
MTTKKSARGPEARSVAGGVLTCIMVATGLFLAPCAARANGYGETWSDGMAGRTLIHVIGQGTKVTWVDVGHQHTAEPWLNYCGSKTKAWGTKSNGKVVTEYSLYESGCTPFAFFGATGLGGTFKDGSYIYAQAKHDGSWRPGKPRVWVWK